MGNCVYCGSAAPDYNLWEEGRPRCGHCRSFIRQARFPDVMRGILYVLHQQQPFLGGSMAREKAMQVYNQWNSHHS